MNDQIIHLQRVFNSVGEVLQCTDWDGFFRRILSHRVGLCDVRQYHLKSTATHRDNVQRLNTTAVQMLLILSACQYFNAPARCPLCRECLIRAVASDSRRSDDPCRSLLRNKQQVTNHLRVNNKRNINLQQYHSHGCRYILASTLSRALATPSSFSKNSSV
jgi:hypothetical protein